MAKKSAFSPKEKGESTRRKAPAKAKKAKAKVPAKAKTKAKAPAKAKTKGPVKPKSKEKVPPKQKKKVVVTAPKIMEDKLSKVPNADTGREGSYYDVMYKGIPKTGIKVSTFIEHMKKEDRFEHQNDKFIIGYVKGGVRRGYFKLN